MLTCIARSVSLRLFVPARRGWFAFSLIILLSTFTLLLGLRVTPLPSAYDTDTSAIPMWRLFSMGVGIVPVLSLSSSLRDLEEAAGPVHRRTERFYIIVLSLVGGSIYLLMSSLSLPLSALSVVARSLFGWFGLALLSGRLFGWRLAWACPVAIFCIITYWGGSGANDSYAWWEFSARPVGDVRTLLLVSVLFSFGIVGYSLTPWRLRSFRLDGIAIGRRECR